MSFKTKINLVHAVRSLKKRLKTSPKLLRNFTNSWERSLLNQKYGKDVKIWRSTTKNCLALPTCLQPSIMKAFLAVLVNGLSNLMRKYEYNYSQWSQKMYEVASWFLEHNDFTQHFLLFTLKFGKYFPHSDRDEPGIEVWPQIFWLHCASMELLF